MTRVRIAGIALLILLRVGLLTPMTNRAGAPPKKAEAMPMATGMAEGPPDIVDPKTGNIHLQNPIQATREKPAAPPSGH